MSFRSQACCSFNSVSLALRVHALCHWPWFALHKRPIEPRYGTRQPVICPSLPHTLQHTIHPATLKAPAAARKLLYIAQAGSLRLPSAEPLLDAKSRCSSAGIGIALGASASWPWRRAWPALPPLMYSLELRLWIEYAPAQLGSLPPPPLPGYLLPPPPALLPCLPCCACC